jgi:ATP-binding protein involved in chromosome partitioning
MRIAVPVADGVLCAHFGQCAMFAMFDVDAGGTAIADRRDVTPPHHEPGVYPRWLAEQGVTVVVAGGMGSKARNLFEERGVQVVLGAAEREPESLVKLYLEGLLPQGGYVCDH